MNTSSSELNGKLHQNNEVSGGGSNNLQKNIFLKFNKILQTVTIP